MEEVIFTSAGLLDLLSQIDELKDYDMHLDDNNGAITLTIGDSTYSISKPTDEVEIPEEALEEISDIVNDTVDSFDEEPEAVESGIVKEALKTLLVGGAVRLVAKILK